MSIAEELFGLPWRGIHHIALVTADLDATVRFYRDVLGMVVGNIAGSEAGRGRHCIIFARPDDPDTWGFHFFERPTTETTLGLADHAPASLVPHVALRLSDEPAANLLRERLKNAGVTVTEIPELGSFVFFDNNRLCLEATWPTA